MDLTTQEAIFVKEMVLHGNRDRAIRAAFPRLEEQSKQAALQYMLDNPFIRRHIDAGILYIYRHVIPDVEVNEPVPLSIDEKKSMLAKIISGEREKPEYVSTAEGLKVIFVLPDEEEIADAKHMLQELDDAEQMKWMM